MVTLRSQPLVEPRRKVHSPIPFVGRERTLALPPESAARPQGNAGRSVTRAATQRDRQRDHG